MHGDRMHRSEILRFEPRIPARWKLALAAACVLTVGIVWQMTQPRPRLLWSDRDTIVGTPERIDDKLRDVHYELCRIARLELSPGKKCRLSIELRGPIE